MNLQVVLSVLLLSLFVAESTVTVTGTSWAFAYNVSGDATAYVPAPEGTVILFLYFCPS